MAGSFVCVVAAAADSGVEGQTAGSIPEAVFVLVQTVATLMNDRTVQRLALVWRCDIRIPMAGVAVISVACVLLEVVCLAVPYYTLDSLTAVSQSHERSVSHSDSVSNL